MIRVLTKSKYINFIVQKDQPIMLKRNHLYSEKIKGTNILQYQLFTSGSFVFMSKV